MWSFVTVAPRPQPWEKKNKQTRKHFPVLPLHGNYHQNTSFWEIFTYIVHQGNSMSTGIVLPTWTGPQGLHRERGSAGQSLVLPVPSPSHLTGLILTEDTDGWYNMQCCFLTNSKGNITVPSIRLKTEGHTTMEDVLRAGLGSF